MTDAAYIDPFAPKGPAVDVASEGSDGSESHENGVPKGSSKEVLAWVGDDPERALLALEAEQAEDKPRKGLVSDLEDLVQGPEDEEEEAPVVEQPIVEAPPVPTQLPADPDNK